MTDTQTKAVDCVPLRSAQEIDLESFNALIGPDAYDATVDPPRLKAKPVRDIKKLFYKQVIVDDETILNVETIKVPGFIGISNNLLVQDPQGNTVSGHEDIVQFLNRDGLLICTYQYNKDKCGTTIDLRWPWSPNDKDLYMDTFLKNEGHHSGAIVPARRLDHNGYQLIDSYASFNEPDAYHDGMYGDEGFVAIAQHLVFDEFVTQEQARGYTNSIICWMGLLNPFIEFASDYDGGDPTRVVDKETLKELLKNGLLASLGLTEAIDWLGKTENTLYCAEFMYVSLNTVLFPFNKQTLTLLLDGNEEQVKEVLALRDRHNNRRLNFISERATNPEFKNLNIPMPVVPADLPPFDELMAHNGRTVDPNSLPFPPFKLSQVMRRAFHTLLPRHKIGDEKLAEVQARLFTYLEPMLLRQLGLESASEDEPKVVSVREFMKLVAQQLERRFDSYEEFDRVVDGILQKADEMLVGANDLVYFVPPRIYVDLGQNDGDDNLPKGWGFKLETVGALIGRSAIKGTAEGSVPNPEQPIDEGSVPNPEQPIDEGSVPNPEQPIDEGSGNQVKESSKNPLKALGLKK